MPLNNNLEEEEESCIPTIGLCEGPNVVGRNCIPITDKRLSRKHFTVHATASGSAEVFVVYSFICFDLITKYACYEFVFFDLCMLI